MNKFLPFLFVFALVFSSGCKRNKDPKLIFKFRFIPTQVRLNNLGQEAAMPAGHAGQNPFMRKMSAHYLELAPNAYTQVGAGNVLYKAPETTAGGSTAIDFSQAITAGHDEEFYSLSLSELSPGTYEYLRVSLAYQNYVVKMNLDSTFVVNGTNYPINQEFDCTVASFVGFNTYITSYNVKNRGFTVNANKKQGYWGFESEMDIYGNIYQILEQGQAPEGATTVVNPLNSTSPIPAGSCLVTGKFEDKLEITGKEKDDIIVYVNLSTNKSFEWEDLNGNGKWDPTKGEKIVDMGLRGLIPKIED